MYLLGRLEGQERELHGKPPGVQVLGREDRSPAVAVAAAYYNLDLLFVVFLTN